MKFKNRLAERTDIMGANAIREILKAVSQPGMISLAGGIPSPESFPMDMIKELTETVLDKYSSSAFQYDLTEGFMPLRESLVPILKRRGIFCSADRINITSGSQGLLDAAAKILISKGDKIAVEAPTYLGAISAFNPYEPEYVKMEMDDEGVIPESLEDALINNDIKFIYLIPTFQNPTGRSISLERRKQIAEIIIKHDAILFEDDPYSELRYRGNPLPPIASFAPENVIYASTLSKVFAPGLRIGFFTAPELIRKWLVLAKQGIDLHTSTFNQALAAEYITGGYLYSHLPEIIDLYRPKQDAMIAAAAEFFPDNFITAKSDGGMFLWITGPAGFDMMDIYSKAIENKVAFVPGKFFYTEKNTGIETMRLNYTMADTDTIYTAMEKLGSILKQNY